MVGTDIKKLYGVGEARARSYEKLGIRTVEDLLVHYPRGYEDRGNIRLLCEADGEGKSAHLLTVATEPKSARIKGRMSLLKFRAYDDSGVCEITFFNQDFLRNVFTLGATFRFYGRVERKNNRYAMTAPAYEPWREDAELPPLVPVYPLTEGLSQKQLAKDMKSALTLQSVKGEEDMLPSELRRRHGLCLRSFALRNIHAPESFSALAAAKRRLIFEEFFLFSLGLSATAKQREITEAEPCSLGDYQSLCRRLPYELTDAQKRVAEEIRADMAKGQAMNRILIGDVGSGKTVCAAIAMWIALQNGRQAVLMAPTEILARQHYADLCDMFLPLGIQPVLLCGSMSASEKKRIHKGLSAPDPAERISLVVGTQALLSEGVEFAAPGVVIADEQHRFGVNQRATLAEKNRHSHMLVMSATPIPRTLALSLYGDLDVSLLDEMPAGRQRVDTFVVDESYRERLRKFILKQTEEGGQIYVVCPSIEENEEEETDLSLSDIDGEGRVRRSAPLKSAVGYAEELSKALPTLRVAVVHGKMKTAEKDAVMRNFSSGEIDVLVSTTVIEVGVNIPNACLMIVENADRFGLSQLHQLRGRVGRGKRKSYCVLVSEAATGENDAHTRLSVMKTCYDGYSIAEHDLQMRGPGDFLRTNGEQGFRQSGGVRFRLAELCDDTGLMKEAMSEARLLIEADPTLAEHPTLAECVRTMFAAEQGTIN